MRWGEMEASGSRVRNMKHMHTGRPERSCQYHDSMKCLKVERLDRGELAINECMRSACFLILLQRGLWLCCRLCRRQPNHDFFFVSEPMYAEKTTTKKHLRAKNTTFCLLFREKSVWTQCGFCGVHRSSKMFGLFCLFSFPFVSAFVPGVSACV